MVKTNKIICGSRPTVVLGVTGGVAAYKSVEVLRGLTKAGFDVLPVLTDSCLQMVGAKTFDALATEPARTSLWQDSSVSPHTDLAHRADIVVICPATARVISDIRTGRSADLLMATVLASEAPLLVCPAMHTEMWHNQAVQENMKVLVERGVNVVEPEIGELAGGDSGIGRLADPKRIVANIIDLVGIPQDLAGRRVLVTAGGTQEHIDPVRFIGNRSTGKQGHAIAEMAAKRGASVTLVTTSKLESSSRVRRTEVVSAAQMHTATISLFPDCDVLVMAAAVADFTPKQTSATKLRKTDGIPAIELVPTVDILSEVAKVKGNKIVVGFSAQDSDDESTALKKKVTKQLDYLVANNILTAGAGFGTDTNAARVYGPGGSVTELPMASKCEIASAIWDLLVNDSF